MAGFNFGLASLVCASMIGCIQAKTTEPSSALTATAVLPADQAEPVAEQIPVVDSSYGSMLIFDLPKGVAMAAGSLVLSIPKASSQSRPVLGISWRDESSAGQCSWVNGMFSLANGPGSAYFKYKPQQWELLINGLADGEVDQTALLPESAVDRDIKIAWQKYADNWQITFQDLASGQVQSITNRCYIYVRPPGSQPPVEEQNGFMLKAILDDIPRDQPQLLQIQHIQFTLSAAHKDNCRLLNRSPNDQVGAVTLSQDQKRCEIGPSQMRERPLGVGADADGAAAESTPSR